MLSSRDRTVLEARRFSKNYGDVRAVRDASFSVERGEIFGLIGPDGGGKTTLMRAFVSLIPIDGGSLYYKGRSLEDDPDYVRRNIGYMPQRFSLYQDLTVRENLRFFSDLFDVGGETARQRIEELYRFSGLKPFSRRRAGALSGGMKQKLALSCMLVHSPDVIVLDEPTFGVDPVSRHELWQILFRLREEGTTILVSTAYMDEASLCDRVGLMLEGNLLAVDSPEALRKNHSPVLYGVKCRKPHEVQDMLEASGLCRSCHLFGEGVHYTPGEGVSAGDIERLLAGKGLSAEPPGPIEWGMEDLFLDFMKGDSHG